MWGSDQIPGLSLLTTVCQETSLPVVPIGGIDEDNIATVLEAGGRRVSVCSAVISKPDATAAVRRLKSCIVD